MTNRQAKAAARRIPFNPFNDIPDEIRRGLERVVAKQVRRRRLEGIAVQQREVLREQLGITR